MEKKLKNDFNFKIEVDNENLLIASANNGSFAATFQYNKGHCRRNRISVGKINTYGDNPQFETVLPGMIDQWVIDFYSDKFN